MKTKRKKTRKIIGSSWTHEDSGNFEISKWLLSKHLDTWVWTQKRDWAWDLGIIDIGVVTVVIRKDKAAYGKMTEWEKMYYRDLKSANISWPSTGEWTYKGIWEGVLR